MGFVTREFVHLETLERAKRWLIEVGFHPSRIEIHTHGTPRITVSVEPGQAAEVNRVLDAVAVGDPEGARASGTMHSIIPSTRNKKSRQLSTRGGLESETFDIGWRPVDAERDVTQTSTEIEKQKKYREERD